MGNGVHIVQFHHAVGQQTQRPAGMSRRRPAATQRHQVRLKIPIRLPRMAPFRLPEFPTTYLEVIIPVRRDR